MKQMEPAIIKNGKYGITEVAELLGVSAGTINRWTSAGLMRAGRRRVNGRRFWTGEEILRAWRAQI